MKLLYAPTSPFARKVRVVAAELGLEDRIEIERRPADPVDADPEIYRLNPLGQIPVLLIEDGPALYDSPVICEYLDWLAGGRLFPPPGAERWNALRLQALADGLLGAALLGRYERHRRPAEKQWDGWYAGQLHKVGVALDALEREAAGFGSRIDIGTVAAACAIGYLELRYADLGWAEGRPRLAAWYAEISARPSMTSTRPDA